jgi:dTDP-4-amino-4,6-dideoxygalactose transaminase
MQIPFVDLRAQYQSIREEIDSAIRAVVDSCAFSGGHFVEKFEKEFAEFCQNEFCVGVGSGTEALWMIMLSLGIGTGDEVITVPNTFIATVEAIRFCGATPVFVDVDPGTYTLDPAGLERAITKRTKAVIPVHLFGQVAEMESIAAICANYGLALIEDACQAHGAEYKGRKSGSLGVAAAFSFYPGKNLGAYGEAGAVVTGDKGLADTIRMIRDHGQSKRYLHEINGWNGRMDGIQAAVLSVKLKYLERWNEERIGIAERYSARLDRRRFGIPLTAPYAKHIFHIYAIRSGRREAVIEGLKKNGISYGIHYPVSVHLQKACEGLGLGKGSFPVAESCAEELLSLPMFAELGTAKVDFISSTLNSLGTNN